MLLDLITNINVESALEKTQLPDWLTIVIPAIITGVGYYLNYRATKKNFKRELDKYKLSKVYEVKQKAIFDSMKFIDNYLSWLNFKKTNTFDKQDSSAEKTTDIPVRQVLTKEELTIEARRCYNLLCSTCETSEIVDCFIKILFEKNANILELYNHYRNYARKELGLNEIELSTDKVFLSVISTNDLEQRR